MFALEPFAAVVDLAEVDPVFQEVGEGAVGEGNAALIFRDFGVASLGDDASAVEFGDQFAEGLAVRDSSRKMVRTVSASVLLMTSFLSLAS